MFIGKLYVTNGASGWRIALEIDWVERSLINRYYDTTARFYELDWYTVHAINDVSTW